MPDQIEDLLKALRNEKWIADLEKRTEHLTQIAAAIYDGDEYYFQHFECEKGHWVESLMQATTLANGPKKSDFEKIANRLALPRIITATELWEAFEVYLNRVYGIPGPFDEVYEHFLDHVEHRLLAVRKSDLFKVCEVTGLKERVDPSPNLPWIIEAAMVLGKAELLGTTPELPAMPSSDSDEEEVDPVHGLVLWSGNGITFECRHIEISSQEWRFQSPAANQMTSGVLHARLEGRMSPEAMRLLQAELLPVLQSIIRSAAALWSPLPAAGGFGPLPSIGLESLRESIPFIGGCYQMLFAARTKKDTFEGRISNAIRLLCEADKQTNSAISLALSVTALEALLGSDTKGDIATPLARNVAVLLEPRPNQRARAADFTKRLYNLRSRVLHGDTVEGEDDTAARARRLAAGVLYGIWYRRDYLPRVPIDPGSPEEFLKTLQECTWTGKPPDSAPDIAEIRSLWEGLEPEADAQNKA